MPEKQIDRDLPQLEEEDFMVWSSLIWVAHPHRGWYDSTELDRSLFRVYFRLLLTAWMACYANIVTEASRTCGVPRLGGFRCLDDLVE
jgi:hypothetical protein